MKRLREVRTSCPWIALYAATHSTHVARVPCSRSISSLSSMDLTGMLGESAAAER